MPVNKPIIGVAAAVVAIAAAAGYYLHAHREQLPVEASAPVAPVLEPEPAIAHPLPAPAEGGAPAVPLPTLADSDASMLDALTAIAGVAAVKDYLLPENIVRHLVVSIDNLPRQKVAVEKLPTAAVGGVFAANGDEVHATLDRQNFERYKPLVAVIKRMDMQKLAAVYIHYYPLFQQSYQDLGYPNGYFNDRLVQVIDVMLAAPQPAGPVELVRPNVMYTFADPALEARPAGQKLMIRVGPENASAIKEKLVELRAIVAAAPLKQ
jgi:Protein of unknown function (DUF3014)